MDADDITAESEPASYASDGVRLAPAIKDKYKSDPAFDAPGMPPNYGQPVLPQVVTMQGLISGIANVYRVSDEALKHSFEDARFMEQDVGITECIQARTRSVALLNWHLEPDDADSHEQTELCDELTKILRRIPRFMQVRETLAHAVWPGRDAVSFRYGWRQFGNRMFCVPVHQQPLHGDKLVFRLDDGNPEIDPDQVGIRIGQNHPISKIGKRWDVETTDRGQAYFLSPWERRLLAIHKHQMQDGAYESPQDAGRIHGVGIRSLIYWEWFQKQETLRWLMEYLERSAFGIELWYYPASNPNGKSAMETAAKQRVNNFRNIVFVPRPGGDQQNQYGIEHIETGMAGADILMKILQEYFGHRIKRLILGQTLTSESEGGGLGSDGIARVHLGTFKDIVRYDATNLEETITTDIVTPIKEWNFPKANHFGVRFVIETEEIDSDERMQHYKAAWDMGARISEKKVLDAIGLAVPGNDDRTLMNPQIAAAEQQQAAAQQQLHQQRAGGTALGKSFQDAMRHHGHSTRIADAGQRTVLGDAFDEHLHRHAMAGKFSEALQGA